MENKLENGWGGEDREGKGRGGLSNAGPKWKIKKKAIVFSFLCLSPFGFPKCSHFWVLED